MKLTTLLLLMCCGLAVRSQNFNNEWIDYNKTYYKFKIGATGLYRINQPALQAASLGSVEAQHFQLWRNGQQIAIYTSVATGTLGAGDYIEFWGERNDGKPDLPLYRNADNQLNGKYSLETDTATYFLTVNTTSANLRLETTPSVFPGSPVLDPYFTHTVGRYWQERINPGFSQREGDNTYSSAYEVGEGWSSFDIQKNTSHAYTFTNLFVYSGAGAPDGSIKVHGSGNSYNVNTANGIYYPRQFQFKLNNQTLVEQEVPLFDPLKETRAVPVSLISTNSATATITNVSTMPDPLTDRIVVHMVELTYPREFNFDNQTNFTFKLAASASNSVQIANFNHGGTAPVLYDLTNNKRYVTDISSGSVRVQLQPSATERTLVLVSAQASNITAVTNFQSRNFVNYGIAANQGNYLLITHSKFLNGPNGTQPVDAYKAYRSSAPGGSFNAKIYMIEELIDQFAFGIKHHPLAVRNFIRFARATYSNPLKNILLVGRGQNYIQNRNNENGADLSKLSFIPTFGQPASDILLAAEPGPDENPLTPIGRLSVVQPEEITIYLNKVVQYELAQVTGSPLIQDKAWMKNFVHVVGASEPFLVSILEASMNNFKEIAIDTLIGGKVSTFSKSSVDIIQQLSSQQLQTLFREGLGMLTYFGHANATALEYNLDDPYNYDNAGKYPVFFLLGCNAGNFFNYNPARLQVKETISEKYVLADNRGGIACIAGTSLGVVNGLETYATSLYNAMAKTQYGKTIGEIMQETIRQVFFYYSPDSHLARIHCEQTLLHGDPALKMDVSFPKPDYVIEDQLVTIAPTFISVADPTFKVKAKFLNIGKAINKDIAVEVKRIYPGNPVAQVIFRDTVPGTRYMDSLEYDVPIDAIRDKGLNRITITVEADGNIDELYETNNTLTKDVFIYEDEARPISPYNFAIINTQPIKLYASTANPFSPLKNYMMELDTTELFNSPLKVSRTVNSVGGLLEFDPGITFTDSTVYYWRVASSVTTGSPKWNNSSFIYLPASDKGFNQSHFFQHDKSEKTDILLTPNARNWKFDSSGHFLTGRNAVFLSASGQEGDFVVKPDGDPYIRSACVPSSLIFVLFDPNTFKPVLNDGRNGAFFPACQPSRRWNFEWTFTLRAERKKMMEFMDAIPDGYIVVVRSIVTNPFNGPFIDQWKDDTTDFGSGQSLYHRLKAEGLTAIDSFYRSRAMIMIYQKNRPGFGPVSKASDGIYDVFELTKHLQTPDSIGYIKSPLFGRAKAWKALKWRGTSAPDVTNGDHVLIDVLGVDNVGQETVVIPGIDINTQDLNLSTIDAAQFPYLRLRMRNADSVNFTAYQLRYWRITYDPVPEGAIAPNKFLQTKDVLDLGEPLDFKVAFQNVTPTIPFDSVLVRMVVTGQDNVQSIVPLRRRRPMSAAAPDNSDSLQVGAVIPTSTLAGNNSLFIEVNPDDDQPEQHHFNNFAYLNFRVKGDTLNPLLDVTFDGVHILNRDIVSSKPEIIIKLKDEQKWLLLDTNSLVKVTIKFPDGSSRIFPYTGDTLRFIPAGQAPSTDNTATVNFKPFFEEDGIYELMVSGKDKSNNNSGVVEYRVQFEVINKPMISNMLNYPNPFTTSTAFVFTITGSEVPQNIRIQIMTITGKIVRDITKEELGPLHIGRNITEFKWDGTDQYGAKLANGIYLYRVITNLNGKKLDKYRSEGEDTDKYFKEGYGKMYLMR